MSISKPREFWIEDRYREVILMDVPTQGHVCYTHPVLKNGIHVIEASYAKELEAKLAVAVKALEEINREELNSQRPGGGYTRSATISFKALEQLKAGKGEGK